MSKQDKLGPSGFWLIVLVVCCGIASGILGEWAKRRIRKDVAVFHVREYRMMHPYVEVTSEGGKDGK